MKSFIFTLTKTVYCWQTTCFPCSEVSFWYFDFLSDITLTSNRGAFVSQEIKKIPAKMFICVCLMLGSRRKFYIIYYIYLV